MPNFRVTIVRKGFSKNGSSVRKGFREAKIVLDGATANAAKVLALEKAGEQTYGSEYEVEYDGNADVEYGTEYDCEFEATDVEFVPETPTGDQNFQTLYQTAIVQLSVMQSKCDGMAKALQDKEKAAKNLKTENKTLARERGEARDALDQLQKQDRYNASAIDQFGELLGKVVDFLVDKTPIGQKLKEIINARVDQLYHTNKSHRPRDRYGDD